MFLSGPLDCNTKININFYQQKERCINEGRVGVLVCLLWLLFAFLLIKMLADISKEGQHDICKDILNRYGSTALLNCVILFSYKIFVIDSKH